MCIDYISISTCCHVECNTKVNKTSKYTKVENDRNNADFETWPEFVDQSIEENDSHDWNVGNEQRQGQDRCIIELAFLISIFEMQREFNFPLEDWRWSVTFIVA